MKRYLYIFIAIFALILTQGCEDYLDRNPQDQISSGTYWKAKADFDNALVACYGMMLGLDSQPWDGYTMGGHFAYMAINLDNLTDNGICMHWYGNVNGMVTGNITPVAGGYINSMYYECYRVIARCNILLKQLGEYTGSDFNDADKALMEAEARALRAFNYFALYQYYGEVPIILEPLPVEEQAQPKKPKSEVLAAIIADLDFAIANCADVPYHQNSGHISKTSAQAIKARVLIYAAYGDNGTPDLTTLTTVRSLCSDLMSSGHALSTNFTDIFRKEGQGGNAELIWSLNYLAPNNANAYGTDVVYGWWGGCQPMDNLIDSYECNDGLPWGTGPGDSPLTNPDDKFENRDMRVFHTFAFGSGADFGDGNGYFETGYSFETRYKKFLDPSNQQNLSYSIYSDQDIPVIRYAEVLLMYAEAENEIDGPANAYAPINELRARVGQPALAAGMSQAEMRDRIRKERRWELCGESGLRNMDIKRWHIAAETFSALNAMDPLDRGTVVWEDRFYHWPFPQDEIDKAGGVLIQNSDY
jgi:starch-binding outer membrane protein, SusD/RagB family